MSCCGGKSGDLRAKMDDSKPSEVVDSVKEYYGKVLSTSKDLKTNACCTAVKMPKHIREAVGMVHDEVVSKYYGCGLVIPDSLDGCSVLDLGSGSGRDCYIVSKLVGSKGRVTGIDMTDEQLDVAKKYIDYHRDKFGYAESNVDFVKGYIEDLANAGLRDNTFDIIISNCVVNLSPDKSAVLREAFRVLKPGGELYFSDVYADQNLAKEVRENKVLWGECIAGALYWQDLYTIAAEVGFTKPRLVSVSAITVDNKELQEIVGQAKFVSATYRLFKLQEGKSEATQVVYNGTIEGCEDKVVLDVHNVFKAEDIVDIDSEVATILQNTRFADDFTFCSPSVSKKAKSTQDVMVDPFQYLAEKNVAGCADSSSCCGASKQECKSSSGSGCC